MFYEQTRRLVVNNIRKVSKDFLQQLLVVAEVVLQVVLGILAVDMQLTQVTAY